MNKYTWESRYCVYDVCTCKHPFMEHGKKCSNQGYFDAKKQEFITTKLCSCKKFKFVHSEDMDSYKDIGDQ